MENEVVKILFVCHGNICRSTMAESLMTELVKRNSLEDLFHIASAGTSKDELGNPVYPATVRVLNKHKIPVIEHYAVQMVKEDYEKYDLLLGMDSANITNMKRIAEGDSGMKIHRMMDCCHKQRDIADPWYTGEFQKTFEEISEGCDALLLALLTTKTQVLETTEIQSLDGESMSITRPKVEV